MSNFYLSFVRYPILRLSGRAKDDIENVTGIPVIASAMVVIGLPFIRHVPYMSLASIILIAIDTGGIHWFFVSMLYQLCFWNKKNHNK